MNKKAKTQINKSGENFKDAGEALIQLVGGTTKGLYNAVDAGDKYLGSNIGTPKYKILDLMKNNILKILIAGGTIFYSGHAIYEKVLNHDEQEESHNIKESIKLDFSSIEKNIFRNREVFFDKNLDQGINNNETVEKLDNGTTILRDAGLTFYLMTKDDIKNKENKNSSRTNTINHLRKKLSQYPEFSYLTEDGYKPSNNVVTKSFNIRPNFKNLAENSSLDKTPFWIPIPVKKEIRKINTNVFQKSGTAAIDLMGEYNETYEYIRNKISKEYSQDNIGKLLTSIALLETGETTGTIGADTYHRREAGSHDCFSFGPSHVLMEYGGLKSRKNLGVTEGQMYHPTISNMVVMGFMIEKISGGKLGDKDKIANKLIKLLNFIDNNHVKANNKSLNKFCAFYNGGKYKDNNYHINLSKVLNKLESKDEENNNETTKDKGDFEYLNKSSDEQYLVYKYKIKTGGTPGAVKRAFKEAGGNLIGVEITDKTGESQHEEGKKIPAGTDIYIKEKL